MKKFNLLGNAKSHTNVDSSVVDRNQQSNFNTQNNIYGAAINPNASYYNTIQNDRPNTQMNQYNVESGRDFTKSINESGMRNGKSVSTLTTTTNNIYQNFENYENQRRINFQDSNYQI